MNPSKFHPSDYSSSYEGSGYSSSYEGTENTTNYNSKERLSISYKKNEYSNFYKDVKIEKRINDQRQKLAFPWMSMDEFHSVRECALNNKDISVCDQMASLSRLQQELNKADWYAHQ